MQKQSVFHGRRMKIYLLFLFAAIIAIAACTQTESQVEREYVCPDGKTTVKIISLCPAVQAVEQKDPAIKTCEEMPEVENIPFSDYCFMGLAYKAENATLCKKVSESRRFDCYSGMAVLKSDATLCDSAGTRKDSCYSTYATQKGDVTACDKITDINNKDSCYSQYGSRYMDSAVCDKIRMPGNKDNCYRSIASSQCDSSLCNKITNANTKDQCIQQMQYCSGQPQKPVQK